jgi:hypothetical protein
MTFASILPFDAFSSEFASSSSIANGLEPRPPADSGGERAVHKIPEAAQKACLKEAARRLSPVLLHLVHQSTAKSRDRALAALVVLIYGPTPFGGANNIKDVATRYGMTEQNLYQVMGTLRALLQSTPPADDRE